MCFLSLQSPPRMKEYHMTSEDTRNRFTGHKGAVKCVSCSLDGETLMSGGVDESVLIWHIPSRQLIRTLTHKGAITNAFFCLAPRAMFDQEVKLTLISSNFKRMIDTEAAVADNHVVEIMVTGEADYGMLIGSSVGFTELTTLTSPTVGATRNGHAGGDGSLQELDALRAEVKNLKRANKDLYQFSVKNILKN